MDYKVKTAITTEPVSLAEVKLQRKLSSNTVAGDMSTSQTITPGSKAITPAFGILGTAVDVLGLQAVVNLNSGANGSSGSVAAKIQESDNGTTWTDFTGGGFTTVTEANDNAIQELAYTGGKRYIRVVATVAGAACTFGADVIAFSGDTTEDTLLTMFIKAARGFCEKITRRAFATQTIEAYLDAFPAANYIELPCPPLQNVTSIKYKDSAGNETTMTVNTDYLVDTDRNIGRIVLPYAGTWPTATLWPVNPITIEYIAGYTATNLIPDELKIAVLLLIGHLYEHREETVEKALQNIPFGVDSFLSLYRAGWL